jgi:hypothetical protein
MLPAAGSSLSRTAHVVVTSPVVCLEVSVLCFELEGASLGLECACLLVKRGGLLSVQSLCQRHVQTVLMLNQELSTKLIEGCYSNASDEQTRCDESF